MFAQRKTVDLVAVSPVEDNFPIKTVGDVIDAYLKDRYNPFSDRPCKTAKSIESHFVAVRAIWGHFTVEDFQKRSKARAKDQVEIWRRGAEMVPPLTTSTCRKRISQLKTAYKFCIEEELLSPSLMPVLKLPPQGAPRERVLTLAEIKAIMGEADSPRTEFHIRLVFHISLRTGQRQGAIHALQWSKHIDFETRTIRFRDTEEPNERSKKRRTSMPMDDVLFQMLWDAKEIADTDFVLERNGERVKSTYVGVKAMYARAGVVGAHRHDLRRTAATLLGDLKDAASFIGDTEAVTKRNYFHEKPEARLPQIQKLSDILDQARKAG